MAYIIESPNPFEIGSSIQTKRHQHPGGITIKQWILETYPGWTNFEQPTYCAVNGKPVLREYWDTRVIKADDVVNFVTASGYFALVIIAIVLVVAFTVYSVLNTPVTPGEPPASDPVFSVKGQQNEIRLGEPVEVCYGRNRIYPSFASRPFFQYINNDQFEYALFCLGQGKYEISAIQIGDTPIADFQEVEHEIIPPGGTVTLFPTNVVTSVEAGGQTLLAPNDEGYSAPGWVGPFPTNPASTTVDRIQIDLIYPKGLYVLDKKGGVHQLTITTELEARQIDNAGTPIGSFFALDDSPYNFSAATTTPQRRTINHFVTSGRYEVRIRRTDTKNLSAKAGHEVVWDGLRGYIEGSYDFGDKTLMAVKIRATNNLNERTQAKFNVIATRMLPYRETSGEFSDPQTTRSIIWAFVDLFRSRYGGRIDDSNFFDWDTLMELETLYAGRGDYFDWCFRDPITVWEAAKTICRVGRATPLLIGSLITMRRDGPLSIPVTFFSTDNIVKDSFKLAVQFWDLDEFDGVAIEYTDATTGYKQEIVNAVLPGDPGDHLQNVRLPGCQSRAQAYREGLFLIATARYLRDNVQFETGMEGHIVTFGDLIAVAHDVPRWGQAGYIVNAERDATDGYLLWLSEPLDWSESGAYVLLLRGRAGQVNGPYEVHEMSNPQQVLIISGPDIDFQLDGTTEPMLFLFGLSGSVTQYCKVIKVEPQGNEIIRVTAVNYDSRIHSFDDLEVPALNTAVVSPQAPDLPTIGFLYITQVEGPILVIQAAWTSAFGAQYYIVQTSTDGTNWEERGTTTQTSIQLDVDPGEVWIRVAAVNNGQGAWKSDTIEIGVMGELDNTVPWTDIQWTVTWDEVLNATGYQVKVYDNTTSPVLKHTETVTARSFNYTYTTASSDSNLHRAHLVTVVAIFDDEIDTVPSELALTNSIPDAPTSPAYSFVSQTGSDRTYSLSWTNPHVADLIRVKVWLSTTNGFDPSVVSPTYDNTAGSPGWAGVTSTINVTVPKVAGAHPAYYWRVAVYDVWGTEIQTNITSQQTIPAFP